MMQAWWMFCICSVVYVVVSLLTPPPTAEQINGLTWSNPLEVLLGKRLTTFWDPRILALVLFLTMAGLYYTFR